MLGCLSLLSLSLCLGVPVLEGISGRLLLLPCRPIQWLMIACYPFTHLLKGIGASHVGQF